MKRLINFIILASKKLLLIDTLKKLNIQNYWEATESLLMTYITEKGSVSNKCKELLNSGQEQDKEINQTMDHSHKEAFNKKKHQKVESSVLTFIS